MKITSVEIVPIDQKHKGNLIFSTGPRASDEFILVRVKTDEGYEGIGSAYAFPPAPLLSSGCTREGAMHLMKDLAGFLIGRDPMQLSDILGSIEKAINGWYTENYYILSHFDHALYDLKGKILNLPVYELLGGLRRSEIPCEWILSYLPTPEEAAEEAKRVVAEGFKAVKLHVNGDQKAAEARIKAVRDAIGYDIPLGLDMGMQYKAPDAARFLQRMDAKYGINFAEQPLRPYDVDGHKFLRSRTDVPLTADHSGMSLEQSYNFMKLFAFDAYHCLLTRVGGLDRARRLCDMLETAQLGYQVCNVDNSIAAAAAAHFAVSRSDRGGRFFDELAIYLYLHGTYNTADIKDDILKEQPMEIKNGVLYAPKGPGLGFELDEDMVEKYKTPGLDTIVVK